MALDNDLKGAIINLLCHMPEEGFAILSGLHPTVEDSVYLKMNTKSGDQFTGYAAPGFAIAMQWLPEILKYIIQAEDSQNETTN